MKKSILFLSVCFLLIVGSDEFLFGQIQYVTIGVNGMTCSACSFGTEMSIRKLDFVQDVKMDLNHTEARVFFKASKDISLDALSQRIKDAGFSVRSMEVTYKFANLKISNDVCFDAGNMIFSFLDVKDQLLNGQTELHIIGDAFMSSAEARKWKLKQNVPCNNNTAGEPVYLVTLSENQL